MECEMVSAKEFFSTYDEGPALSGVSQPRKRPAESLKDLMLRMVMKIEYCSRKRAKEIIATRLSVSNARKD